MLNRSKIDLSEDALRGLSKKEREECALAYLEDLFKDGEKGPCTVTRVKWAFDLPEDMSEFDQMMFYRSVKRVLEREGNE